MIDSGRKICFSSAVFLPLSSVSTENLSIVGSDYGKHRSVKIHLCGIRTKKAAKDGNHNIRPQGVSGFERQNRAYRRLCFQERENPDREPEIWLTSEELADLLKISTRTLQRMRKERVIPYTMLRSKCLYRLSDIEQCIAKRIVTCNPQTLEEFRKNYYLTHKRYGL